MESSSQQLGAFGAALQPRLGDLLLARGLITAEQLAEALERKGPDERLGEALVRLSIVFENDLARTLASQCGLEYVDLAVTSVDRGCARLLPRAVAEQHDVIPIRAASDGRIVVAVADPLDVDLGLIERALGSRIEAKVAELHVIRGALAEVWAGPVASPAPEPDGAAPYRFQVEAERARALCDYLQRLGADAAVGPDGVVAVTRGSLAHVSTAGEAADVEAYVRAWTVVNGVPAQRFA